MPAMQDSGMLIEVSAPGLTNDPAMVQSDVGGGP
jgi:hypothetical protein